MGNSFKSYKDLEVWQKGMALVKEVYKVTNDFPGEEKFGLVNQIRRAVVRSLQTLLKAMLEQAMVSSSISYP